ncbi:MAG: membrane protein insertion efficiency factor YidD [Myxococcota bacterium]
MVQGLFSAAWWGLMFLVASSSVGFAGEQHAPFGPWDAGESREVKRSGVAQRPRRPHPMTGDAAKVPASGPPAPALRADVDLPELALDVGNRVGGALSANPLYLAALFYSGFLTKVDGPRCQHYPTCSRFANQAVARHGLVGVLLGLERVITDENSSALRRLPELELPGETQPRYYDPVDNYEFWLPDRIVAFPPHVDEVPLALPALVPTGSPHEVPPPAPKASKQAPAPSAAGPLPLVIEATPSLPE